MSLYQGKKAVWEQGDLVVIAGFASVICLIIYMKKLLDSHWLRAVQFKCKKKKKSVTPVQKV